ncbi:UNVERIFIED_CONTAM: hypothetical protein K2H54_042495 [Gekko kuhli]
MDTLYYIMTPPFLQEAQDSIDCKFICHYRCRVLIRLDCSGPRYQDSDQNECNEQTVEKDTNVGSEGEGKRECIRTQQRKAPSYFLLWGCCCIA